MNSPYTSRIGALLTDIADMSAVPAASSMMDAGVINDLQQAGDVDHGPLLRDVTEPFGDITNCILVSDALTLLRALPEGSAAAAFFDPQHRGVLDRLQFGNEGARQKDRCALPAMSDEYIDQCKRDIARVLRPSGYAFAWADTFRLCQGDHLRVADVLPPVDLISWDNGRPGMGYRSRRCGDYLLVLQKPPLRAKATWRDHGIPSRWAEKVDRRIHPHIKPAGLIKRLIAAVTVPGDLVIDPAAGSFVVMQIAHAIGRRFIGCDIRAIRNGGGTDGAQL